MSATILIVDDDRSITTSLTLLLKQAGYRSKVAYSPAEALERLAKESFDLVLQDMNFSRETSGEEGLALLRKIKIDHPLLPVILITAWGSISLAVKGVRAGAADFITKPWTHQQLLQSLKMALGLVAVGANQPTKSKVINREDLDRNYDLKFCVGQDAKFLQILEIAARVSTTDASVLITGESGTGKEVLAEAIHRNSKRNNAPFVKVNLGGVPVSLFESEMFGYVKGAFTGATQNRKGRFELADGGTIFLDEIGDLEPSSQVKMLRVLQDRTYEMLGSSQTHNVNVRVISATNRSLSEMVAKGEFREDLLYRLNLIALHLPALRERRDDIPLIANHFLQSIGNVYRRSNLSISKEALQWMQDLPWPGNVRQFKHVIERAVLVNENDILEKEHFIYALEFERSDMLKRPEDDLMETLPEVGSMKLDEMERAMILKSLKHHGGNVSKVAQSLGLTRTSLYRRFEKYGIKI